MRLRKNMKRAAAAALALSVALSAAAPAALAEDYYISNGNITVTVKEDGHTYVRVGDGEEVEDHTGVVIKGGEDPNKQTGNNSDGPADKDTADEAEGQKPVVDAEPEEPAENTGTELVVWPENVNSGEAQKKDGLEPAEEEQKTPDTQKPEGKTDDDTLEASTGQKPVEKAAEDEDDDKDIMTYEANTASTVTKAVNEAVKHIITIINNCTKKDTTVTIENVNIDVSDPKASTGKAAMSVKGAGDTTLKLKGDNTLKSGNFHAGVEKNDNASEPTGKLTITAEDTNASLNAYGGNRGAGIGGGNGQSTSKLEIANGKIHAEGGNVGAGIGGGGGGNGEVTISGGDVDAYGKSYAAGIGGSGVGSGKVTIKNGKVTAKSNGYAAAIGGGSGANSSGDVTILDGTVTTTLAANNPVTGIGGGPGSTKKSTIRILGGVVDAVGEGYGSGIGGGSGDTQVAEVEIGGGAQVTAKGGKGGTYAGKTYGAGAAIGTAGSAGNVAGTEADVSTAGMTTGNITRLDATQTAHSEHSWKEVSHTDAAIGKPGETVFQCETCGATKTEYTPALPTPAPVEEQNGRSAYAALTVEGAAYEMHQESTRYIVTADSDTATLFGCLGNLAELKAQGVDTLVFRTKSRETALDIDTMLSLGAEDTLFTLTHSGSSATLTVGGADHSELIH